MWGTDFVTHFQLPRWSVYYTLGWLTPLSIHPIHHNRMQINQSATYSLQNTAATSELETSCATLFMCRGVSLNLLP